MMTRMLACFVWLAGLSAGAIAVDLEPISGDLTKALGERLSELAGKIENPRIHVDADAEKANGVHLPDRLGVMVVPQKGLKESDELAAKFQTPTGAELAYLFCYHVVPVRDGQPIDASRLHAVTVTTDAGEDRTIHVLHLAVRQLSEDDYRLYGYGKGESPVVDAKFSQREEQSGPEPVAVEIEDADEQTRQGTVVITVFGKYRASFKAAYVE